MLREVDGGWHTNTSEKYPIRAFDVGILLSAFIRSDDSVKTVHRTLPEINGI